MFKRDERDVEAEQRLRKLEATIPYHTTGRSSVTCACCRKEVAVHFSAEPTVSQRHAALEERGCIEVERPSGGSLWFCGKRCLETSKRPPVQRCDHVMRCVLDAGHAGPCVPVFGGRS